MIHMNYISAPMNYISVLINYIGAPIICATIILFSRVDGQPAIKMFSVIPASADYIYIPNEADYTVDHKILVS